MLQVYYHTSMKLYKYELNIIMDLVIMIPHMHQYMTSSLTLHDGCILKIAEITEHSNLDFSTHVHNFCHLAPIWGHPLPVYIM